MLSIPSDIEGKQCYYGDLRQPFERAGFHLNGNWEYDHAYFDSVLHQEEGASVYLRLPVTTVRGRLDQEDALLEFGQPFLIKHVVHIGLVQEDTDFSLMNASGLNQFQPPLDPDDRIEQEERWKRAGEQAIGKIKPYVH